MDTRTNPSQTELFPEKWCPCPIEATPIHDETYFFDDGDCVFLAEGFFFKVKHRAIQSTVELNLAFRCTDGHSAETRTPCSVVCLASLKDHRRRPWTRYCSRTTGRRNSVHFAGFYTLRRLSYSSFLTQTRLMNLPRPNETHLQTTRDGDVSRLMNIAKMCHKYTLPLFETWALQMLVIQCQSPLDHLATCTHQRLDGLMALACLCDDTEILRLVDGAWLSRLDAGQLQWGDALAAGERYSRRQFQGEVYYRLNKEIHLKASTLSPERGFSHLNLTDKQLVRLLSGHALLSFFWSRVRQDPPALGRPMCRDFNRHRFGCEVAWQNTRWPSDSSDVLGGLKAVRQLCRDECSVKYLDTLIERFASTEKAYYFLGSETT